MTRNRIDHQLRDTSPERDESVHPSVERILRRVVPAIPEPDRPYLDGWTTRYRAALNRAITQAISPRLQLVELFAGIGGLGIGLEHALNAVSILQAEAVPERRAVLSAHFPLALQVDDVHRLLEMTAPAEPAHLVIAGGFPCRGMSQANLTGPVGFQHPQTGLWSVMIEVIRRWQPRAVIWENVVGLRSRGLRELCLDLFQAGYDMAWGTLRASELGAPHERSRLFGVAIHRHQVPLEITSRPYRPEWLPWTGRIPPNDHRAPAQRSRVAALGDCVVPVVAWTVGLTAARLLAGWRPDGGRRVRDEMPMNGWIENGYLYELPASPFTISARAKPQRWVVVDERNESPGLPLDSLSYPPALGRIYWWDGESDNVDVELPGGEIMPFPPEWVREKPWPTPTANDGRNKGSARQLERNAPGINALCQTDCWLGGDENPPELLLDYFSGRGAGPGFLEWVQGFPIGWTAPMAASSSLQPQPRAMTRNKMLSRNAA